MGKKTALKLQKQSEYDTQWRLRLKKHKADMPKTKGSKKKSLEEIKELVELPDYIEGWEIRDEKDWKAVSFNVEKQKISYLSHLYVKYDVPIFLFDVLINYKKYRHRSNTSLLINWFLTIAQGGSFRKEAKNYFNKKEAHIYLSAPNHKNPMYNFWWTKCIVAGIPEKFIKILMDRAFISTNIIPVSSINNFYKDYILFFSKYHQEIDNDTLINIIDYISTVRYEGSFSMKGRTLSSIIRLSNEWHRVQFKLAKGGYVAWEGLTIKDWKDSHNNKNWTIKQLKNSTALYKEGQKQRHCVGSYVRSCVQGSSAIFTMDSCHLIKGIPTGCYSKNVTIEVNINSRTITQAKGRLNRKPSKEEMFVIKLWGGKNGLRFNSYL